MELNDTNLRKWLPPESWLAIETIDAHTGGEPLRVVTAGVPDLPGGTQLARRKFLQENLDYIRTILMWEPRGHADMYGCIITPAVTDQADFGVLFLHNEGYSTMCGHGIIAVTKVALETGLIPVRPPETHIRIDTPAGLVSVRAIIENGRVDAVSFRNVPSFVLETGLVVDIPGMGNIRCDIAFGGAFYAYVDAGRTGIELIPENARRLIDAGMQIKHAVQQRTEIIHPTEADLGYLYGTIFTAASSKTGLHSRHVCIFADGEVDRSPTGTGVSGRMALLHRRGEVSLNESIWIESIIGSRFRGMIAETCTFGPHPAVIPEVEGRAFITGRHEFCIDPDDPLKHGFFVR